VQHLQHPGPRRRRHRRRRHPGVRRQGRDPGRLLGLHPPHLRVGRRRFLQHDPRRRRRRDPAAAPGRPRREGHLGAGSPVEEETILFAAIKAKLAVDPTWYSVRLAQIKGVTERPPPACIACTRCTSAASSSSRRSTSTTRSPSPSSTTSTAAANRWSTASSAPPT
jgi:hypothetical protein